LLWSVGVSLFAHVVSFWGVAYFDQNIVNLFLTLAIIATALEHRPEKRPVRFPTEFNRDDERLYGPREQNVFGSPSVWSLDARNTVMSRAKSSRKLRLS
jgi:hypothetical protein